MEVNAYSDLNISNLTADAKDTSPYSASTSLFNKLLAQDVDQKEADTQTSSQGLSLGEKVKDAINNLKEDLTVTSDTTNTHDELTLMLKFKNLQAS